MALCHLQNNADLFISENFIQDAIVIYLMLKIKNQFKVIIFMSITHTHIHTKLTLT